MVNAASAGLAQDPGPGRHRIARAAGLIAFLLFLNILNFTDRLLPTSLGVQMQQTLGFGHANLGLLSGYYFILTYTFASLAFGVIADRWKKKNLIILGLLVWGGMTALTGLASSFGQVIAARMLFGVGQAALTPAALSLINGRVPAGRRSAATGVYYSGLALGGGLSLMVSAWLEPAFGWRGCFLAMGLTTVAMAIPAFLLDESGQLAGAADDAPSSKGGFFSPALLLTLLGAISVVFMSAAGNLRMAWLQAERGFGIGIGQVAGLMYMAGGITGTLLGGWLGDWCEKRRRGGRLLFAAWGQLAITPVVIASYLVRPDSVLFYVAWFGAIMGTMLYYGPVYSIIQDMVGRGRRASAVGLMIFSVNLLGVGPGPWLAGFIGDHHSLTTGLVIASASSFLAFPFFLAAYVCFRNMQRP